MVRYEELIRIYNVGNANKLMAVLGVTMKGNKYWVGSQSFESFHDAIAFAHEDRIRQEQASTKRQQTEGESAGFDRLGINTNISNIEPDLVPLFAKVARFIGIAVTIGLVTWGIAEGWFEDLVKAMGVSYRDRSMALWVVVGVILVVGWFFRFTVGVFFASIVFWLLDSIKKILRVV